MTRSTYEGLRELRPNERPFVLSRASFAGGQRYSALWPGDNQSDWSPARLADHPDGPGPVRLSFVGSDIGGFRRGALADLVHPLAAGRGFTPFMRTHAEFASPERGAVVLRARYEAINRRAIELRYELLPHVYNVMKQSSTTGLPALRPLFVNYPGGREDLRAGRRVPLRRRSSRGAGGARRGRRAARCICPRTSGTTSGRALARPGAQGPRIDR